MFAAKAAEHLAQAYDMWFGLRAALSNALVVQALKVIKLHLEW